MVATKKPVKKASVKKSRSPSRPAAKSTHRPKETWKTLRVGREMKPFLSFSITRQTILWLTLMVVIVVLQILIVIQMYNTSNLIDQVQQSLSY